MPAALTREGTAVQGAAVVPAHRISPCLPAGSGRCRSRPHPELEAPVIARPDSHREECQPSAWVSIGPGGRSCAMSGPAKGAALRSRFAAVQCLAQPGHLLKRSEEQGPWSGKGRGKGEGRRKASGRLRWVRGRVIPSCRDGRESPMADGFLGNRGLKPGAPRLEGFESALADLMSVAGLAWTSSAASRPRPGLNRIRVGSR